MGTVKGVLKAVVPQGLTRKVTASGTSVSLPLPSGDSSFSTCPQLLARVILSAALRSRAACVKTALQQILVSMATLPPGMDRLT